MLSRAPGWINYNRAAPDTFLAHIIINTNIFRPCSVWSPAAPSIFIHKSRVVFHVMCTAPVALSVNLFGTSVYICTPIIELWFVYSLPRTGIYKMDSGGRAVCSPKRMFADLSKTDRFYFSLQTYQWRLSFNIVYLIIYRIHFFN